MKFNPENPSQLAEKILEAEIRLQKLEQEIAEIGQPAGQELLRRLNALKVEDNALKRNFEESIRRGEPDSVRLNKIEALLAHIEREEESVERDAHFLHQAAPSSMAMAVEASVQMADLLSRGMKKVIGNHHPLGESVFVNHTHDHLATQYGLEDQDHPAGAKTPPESV